MDSKSYKEKIILSLRFYFTILILEKTGINFKT